MFENSKIPHSFIDIRFSIWNDQFDDHFSWKRILK